MILSAGWQTLLINQTWYGELIEGIRHSVRGSDNNSTNFRLQKLDELVLISLSIPLPSASIGIKIFSGSDL